MFYQSLDLDSDEHVIMQVRKHWIVFAGNATGLLIAGVFPFAVLMAIRLFIPGLIAALPMSQNNSAVALFFYALWLLAIWLSFFVSWTKYYLDVWYVTEKRIIIVDQKKLFDRVISNVRFDKIQDVTIDVNGFLPTMLGFGTVKVQTAGEDSTELVMTVVRHPEEVRKVIFGKHNEVHDTRFSDV